MGLWQSTRELSLGEKGGLPPRTRLSALCGGAAQVTGPLEQIGRGWWVLTKRGRWGSSNRGWAGDQTVLPTRILLQLRAKGTGGSVLFHRKPERLQCWKRGKVGEGCRECLGSAAPRRVGAVGGAWRSPSRAAEEQVPPGTGWKLSASWSGLWEGQRPEEA